MMPKVTAIHWSSQPVKDWHIDSIAPLPLSEGSKYVLVCVIIVWPNQALLICSANQAVIIQGLENVSTMYGYPHWIDND